MLALGATVGSKSLTTEQSSADSRTVERPERKSIISVSEVGGSPHRYTSIAPWVGLHRLRRAWSGSRVHLDENVIRR